MAARQKQDVAHHLDSITDVVLFQVLAGFSDVVPIIVQAPTLPTALLVPKSIKNLRLC